MAQIQISKPRRATSAEGVDVDLTPAILAEVAQSYRPDLQEAQLVIGHPSMDAPSFGGVRALSFGDGGLMADADPTDNARDLVAKRHYKSVSASFYTPDAPGNPVPGKWYLRHVGLLGAAPPAIKGLRALSFSEQEAGVLTFGDLPGYAGSYMASMLRKLREWFIDKEGLETADRILPDYEVESLREISQRAAERRDPDDVQISGGSPALSFAEPGHAAASSGASGKSDTKLGAMLSAAIDKLVDDATSRADVVARMATAAGIDDGTVNQILRGDIKVPPLQRLRGFSRVLGISVESMTNAIPSALREASFAEFTQEKTMKTLEQLQAELAAANASLAALQEADTARQAAERESAASARHAGHLSFAEGLVSAAKWPVSGKEALVAALDALATPADAGVLSFGEGDARKPLADVLREQLQALPASVSFGEFAKGGASGSEDAPEVVAARAVAYQSEQAAKGERVNTAEAVAHVSRKAA